MAKSNKYSEYRMGLVRQMNELMPQIQQTAHNTWLFEIDLGELNTNELAQHVKQLARVVRAMGKDKLSDKSDN